MRSPFLNLNWRDLFKGAVLALISALATGLYELINTGTLLTWEVLKPVVLVSVMAFVSYLVKNLFTNTQGEIMTPEPK